MSLCQPEVSLFSLVLNVGTEMRQTQAINEVRDKREKTMKRKRLSVILRSENNVKN